MNKNREKRREGKCAMATKKAKRQQFRHENGFGSIVKLSGNRRKPFAVRITTGWRDGKQVRKYLGYYVSEAEALMALAEYHKNGGDLDLNKVTLEDVYQMWYKRIEQKASTGTLARHKMAHDRFGKLGKKQFKDIKAAHLQDWIDAIELKPRTKTLLRSTLHQLYEYAVQNDIINKNYAKYIEINEKAEKNGNIFSNEEIEFLWTKADDFDIQNILILIYTGMRVGELLAMNKEDIRLEDGYAIGGSKTEAGIDRVIPFHDKILPIIRDRVENHKYIVTTERGTRAAYRGTQYRFKKLMEDLNWNHKIHDTRKTGVSIMHQAGIPMETIRKIVGHSGKGVTEQVYLYKDPKELVKEVNKIQI